VTADSDQGNLVSRSLDLYLAPTPQGEKGSRQLTHATALGGVVVEQGGRRGTAERGDYTATDGKFVLSGGQPTLTDASHDTTTGRELTFFVSSDTILISSEAGSRTLTKHRIEK
jgi:lipopolysaccharide export system protein LptA